MALIIAPVATKKTDRSVLSLSTIILFGASGSDLITKCGALVTFFVLIYYLGNVYFPEIGATTSSFGFPPLSLDDSESLGASSSSLAILFYLTEYFRINMFNLVESNSTKKVLCGSTY